MPVCGKKLSSERTITLDWWVYALFMWCNELRFKSNAGQSWLLVIHISGQHSYSLHTNVLQKASIIITITVSLSPFSVPLRFPFCLAHSCNAICYQCVYVGIYPCVRTPFFAVFVVVAAADSFRRCICVYVYVCKCASIWGSCGNLCWRVCIFSSETRETSVSANGENGRMNLWSPHLPTSSSITQYRQNIERASNRSGHVEGEKEKPTESKKN